MSYAHIYLQVSGLLSFCHGSLPAHLREVETEVGIAITDPVDYVLGYRDVLSADRYPFLCCTHDITNPESSGQGTRWLSTTADIVLAYRHSKPEMLEKALLGYSDAFDNMVGGDPGLGGLCDVAEIVALDSYPGAPGAKDMGIVIVSIIMRSEILT